MSYIKATDVLPGELLDLIQKYIEGEYIYIPRKECNKRSWGEITKSKKETNARNAEIYEKYKEGVSTKVLSEMYYLSAKSIQRIILKIKKEKQQVNAP
ncbi:MAG: CD3324 family protein [Clostridium sp.]|uniref:CD3324 family protein n=1 Tax=Clostridium sp. TaxID=1506 RepID=UPI0039EBCE98